jgi:hypothetical protein
MKRLIVIALGLIILCAPVCLGEVTADQVKDGGLTITIPALDLSPNTLTRAGANVGIGALITSMLQGAELTQPVSLLCMVGLSISKEAIDVNFGKPQEEGKEGFWDWSDVGLLLVGWAIQNCIVNAAGR